MHLQCCTVPAVPESLALAWAAVFYIFSLGEILTDGERYCSNSRKVVASCEQLFRDTISTFMDPFLL